MAEKQTDKQKSSLFLSVSLKASLWSCWEVFIPSWTFCFTLLETSSIHQTEAVTRRWSVIKVFLKFLQNSQENSCTRVSFLIKLQTWGLQLYYKRDSSTGVSCEICEIFKNTFFYTALLVVASDRIEPKLWQCICHSFKQIFSWNIIITMKKMQKFFPRILVLISAFHVTGLFLYRLKTLENLWFCDVSGGIEKETSSMKWVSKS